MEHSTVKRIIGEGNPFARHVGIEVAEVGEGSATCTLAVGPQHLNPFGTVNAGAIYAWPRPRSVRRPMRTGPPPWPSTCPSPTCVPPPARS